MTQREYVIVILAVKPVTESWRMAAMATKFEDRRPSLLLWLRMGREVEFGATPFGLPAFLQCGGSRATHTVTCHWHGRCLRSH
jgi:hypothetical protein